MENECKMPLCKVIKGKDGNVETEIMPEDQAFGINPEEFNLFVDQVRMKKRFYLDNQKLIETNRQVQGLYGKPLRFCFDDQQPIEIDGQVQGLCGKPLGLLKKLMMRPGRFMGPYDIGNIGEYDESFFIKENLIQYSRKLRQILFGIAGHNIIRTAKKPYRLALNSDISFCWIEPVSNKENE